MQEAALEIDSLSCFEKFEMPLLRYSYALLEDQKLAKEVVKETFMLFLNMASEATSPKTWLYRTTLNLSLKKIKSRKLAKTKDRQQQLSFFDEVRNSESPDLEIEFGKNVKLLRAIHFLESLPPQYKKILKMKFEDNLSFIQISSDLNLTAQQISVKMGKMTRDLNDVLHEEGIFK